MCVYTALTIYDIRSLYFTSFSTGICDEIMRKYESIKKDRPHKAQADVAMEAKHSSRDEEEILNDAKNKLRLVLSNSSAPVFPGAVNIRDSRGNRLETN